MHTKRVALRDLRAAGRAHVESRFVGQTEEPLADDVALYLRRAAADRERGAEEEPARPLGTGIAEGPQVGDHAVRAGEVLRDLHDVPAVVVGERLAQRGLRAGLASLDLRGERAHP